MTPIAAEQQLTNSNNVVARTSATATPMSSGMMMNTTGGKLGTSQMMNVSSSTVQSQNPLDLTGTSYEQSRRQISSVVVSEEVLGEVPVSGGVRYVEVPVVEEVVRTVPKKQVIEVEKVVPRYEVEWIEQEVSVPQVVYVDKPIERTQIQEVVRTVPKKTYQDVPREVVRSIPRVEFVQVEKVVQVPGQIIEVPRPMTVENKMAIKTYSDKQVPVVVAQTIRPVVCESPEIIDVDVYEYEPEVIPVDIHVAKPVSSQLVAVGATDEVHQQVNVPISQFNSLLRQLNSHLSNEDLQQLPYLVEDPNRPIQFLQQNELPGIVPVAQNARFAEPLDLKMRGLDTTTNTLAMFKPMMQQQQQPFFPQQQQQQQQQQLQQTMNMTGPLYPQQQMQQQQQQQQQPFYPMFQAGMPSVRGSPKMGPSVDPKLQQQIDDVVNKLMQTYSNNPSMQQQVRGVAQQYQNQPSVLLPVLQQIHGIAQQQQQQQQQQAMMTQRGIMDDTMTTAGGIHQDGYGVPPVYPTVRSRELTAERNGPMNHTQEGDAANHMLQQAQHLINQANQRIAHEQQQQQQQQHPHGRGGNTQRAHQQQQQQPRQQLATTNRGLPPPSRSGSLRPETVSQLRTSRTVQPKKRTGCNC